MDGVALPGLSGYQRIGFIVRYTSPSDWRQMRCTRRTVCKSALGQKRTSEEAKIGDNTMARRADHRDAEVGRRVRSRRLECCLSQTELADRIWVTFQQVQKYEKGVNRIGASRLQRISRALEGPITFFFSATPHAAARAPSSSPESVFGFVQTSSAVRIVKAFIGSRAPRRRNCWPAWSRSCLHLTDPRQSVADLNWSRKFPPIKSSVSALLRASAHGREDWPRLRHASANHAASGLCARSASA